MFISYIQFCHFVILLYVKLNISHYILRLKKDHLLNIKKSDSALSDANKYFHMLLLYYLPFMTCNKSECFAVQIHGYNSYIIVNVRSERRTSRTLICVYVWTKVAFNLKQTCSTTKKYVDSFLLCSMHSWM